MASIKWANNYQKPLTNSVVFSNNGAPSNVGLNKYLSSEAQYTPQVKKEKAEKKKPVTLIYTNAIPKPNTVRNCAFLPQNTNVKKHQSCLQMMANRREKSKRIKLEQMAQKTRKQRRHK